MNLERIPGKQTHPKVQTRRPEYMSVPPTPPPPPCRRNSDSDYSDGEEDFYYSEIEVNVDSLTEGLSSLTPTSPTTAGPPPAFPPPLSDAPPCERTSANAPPPTPLSQSAPSALCHIRTDHAYQVPSALGEERRRVGGLRVHVQ